jgi:hypothetical protein
VLRKTKTIPPGGPAGSVCAAEPGHRVVLLEEERVAGRGSSSTRWFVKTHVGWQRPGAIAAAVSGSETPAGRTVWSRRWELVLEEGTLLMRCDTRPAERERREPLDLLLGHYGSREQVVRRYYRLSSSGELVPERGRS